MPIRLAMGRDGCDHCSKKKSCRQGGEMRRCFNEVRLKGMTSLKLSLGNLFVALVRDGVDCPYERAAGVAAFSSG
ncbi:MAG: hypothetical protein LKKZDAJK_002022 [Candidatus Fervidibacter sp.]